jgi:HK97 family phage major capsid protein
MNWLKFVAFLKSKGFEGDGEDFAKVQAWLTDNGHDPDEVEGKDGATHSLKTLYDERKGKKLDISVAQEKADQEAAIDAAVVGRLADIKNTLGIGKESNGPKNEHKHDIEVGKTRLADHPTAGYEAPSKAMALGQFLQDVKAVGSGRPKSERLEAWEKASLSTYANETTGSDGGYAVPEEMRTNIEVRVMGEDSLLSRCDQIPMTTQSLTLPDDETTPWGSSGIQCYWEGEAAAIDQSKPVLKQKRWTTRKVTALVPVTDELAADAPAMGAYLNRKVGEVMDFKVGEAIVRGTGAGQPLGVLNAGCLVSVAKETSQVADTFLGLNAFKMISRLYPGHRSTSVWLINPDVQPYLYRLNSPGLDGIGSETANWGTHIFQPASGISGSADTLLGRPIVYTQHCAELGTVGDVILGSFAQGYGAGIRGGVDAQTSIHFWFDQATTAFRFIMRMDGQPYLSAAIAPRAGSNTMSDFVVTATR